MDIVATCFLPGSFYEPLRREMGLDAIVVLEQVAPRRFVRHSLETVTCDHATCDLGDFDADGKIDFVTGNFLIRGGDGSMGEPSTPESIILLRNLGRVPQPADPFPKR
jgi:hypothetical protein